MTDQSPIAEISIKIHSWKDLPETLLETLKEALQFRDAAKALDEAAALCVAGANAPEQTFKTVAPHPSPLPTCSGERERVEEAAPGSTDLLGDEEDVSPEARVVAKLIADPATKDVATLLIQPLLEKGLRLSGKVRLRKVAAEFSDQPAHKLKFAARHLSGGKHVLFPDDEEIYAAIGRYRAVVKADEDSGHVNGVDA